MSRKVTYLVAILVFTLLFSATNLAAQESPTTEEKLAALQANCSKSAEARAKRHETKSLYERLGGYDGIHALTEEIVRLHLINDEIKHLFDNVNKERLIKNVADFIAAGTGGAEQYQGMTLPASHKRLELTDEGFLSAGGDIVKAMQNKGYGQNEIDEFMCILLSLKDEVVLK